MDELEQIVRKGPDTALVNGSYSLVLKSKNPLEKSLAAGLLYQYLKDWLEISNTYEHLTDDRSFFQKDPYFRAICYLPSTLSLICAKVLLTSKPFLNDQLLQEGMVEYASTAEVLQKLTKRR